MIEPRWQSILPLVLCLLASSCRDGGHASGSRVRIVAVAATCSEDGGTARFLVTRSGGVRDARAVAFAVSGTASNVAGVDFAEAPLASPILIPAGDRDVEIVITPIDDALSEGEETLTVTLLPGGGGEPRGDEVGTVTILDDDPLVTNVTVAEAKALVDGHVTDPDFVVLDVRTPGEFAAGHIAGAVNIDYLAGDFATRLAALDTGKVYLLHCKSGARSTAALPTLLALGFMTIDHMTAGFDGWVAAGYPVSTD
jgi:rhodanese-related sulfurtransferase